MNILITTEEEEEEKIEKNAPIFLFVGNFQLHRIVKS